jgi:putrescine transport system ATP-binding protein
MAWVAHGRRAHVEQDGALKTEMSALTLKSRAAARVLLQLEEVRKRFGNTAAVDGVSLDILEGEFFALLGPSGCGKTTLLRMLAGLETLDDGRILLDAHDLAGTPPYRRPINMMFQNYALFPHLNVYNNIAFGLRQDGLARAEIARRVAEMLMLVRLEGFGSRKPHQLSGGERQRVALARSLVKRPRLLLLDEPLAALDRKLRGETQFELMQLQRELGLTFIIVTHDQKEAMTVADRMGVMDRGRLVQVGTPAEIYEEPNCRWVADFIGDINLIEGCVVAAEKGNVVVETAACGRLGANSAAECKPGDKVWAALRPEKIAIAVQPPEMHDENSAAGEVTEVGYLGDLTLLKLRVNQDFIMKASVANIRRRSEGAISSGDRVWLTWSNDALVVLTR